MATSALPLAGVRVIEPAILLAAPHASSIMADFGAEVIKVEQPGSGDAMRALGPDQLWWKSVSRNKKSITLNLREPEAQDIFRKLVRTADVVIENFRPGTMDRWNIGWEALREVNPKLIMCSQTGFGQDGPYSQRPAYGAMFETYSGLSDSVSFGDAPPTHTGLCDHIAGLTIVYAIMFALYHRDVHGGPGQYIDNAAAESALRIVGDNRVPQVSRGLPMPPKRSVTNPAMSFGDTLNVGGMFQCQDEKWVLLHPGTAGTSIWANLVRLIGREEFLDEEPYPPGSDARTARKAEISATVKDWFAGRPRDEVIKLADEHAITIGPVQNTEDTLRDPQFLSRGIFVDVPDEDFGTLKLVGPIPRFSETPGRTMSTGPHLGKHTEEVLAEIGISADEVGDLRSRGIV